MWGRLLQVPPLRAIQSRSGRDDGDWPAATNRVETVYGGGIKRANASGTDAISEGRVPRDSPSACEWMVAVRVDARGRQIARVAGRRSTPEICGQPPAMHRRVPIAMRERLGVFTRRKRSTGSASDAPGRHRLTIPENMATLMASSS